MCMSNVLVVDDQPEIRTITSRFLSDAGYRVVAAEDAHQALELLGQTSFDVIFTDVHMPGANGLWLADQARAIAPATALVLATGDALVPAFESLRRGVVAYLVKPFNRKDVLAAVENGVRWAVAERAVRCTTQPTTTLPAVSQPVRQLPPPKEHVAVANPPHQERVSAAAVAHELDSFFTVTPDLVCLADLEGRFTRVNPSWHHVLGWTEDELTGRPYVDFVHPDDVAETQRASVALADGETVTKFENRYREKNGSFRWLSWRAKLDLNTGLIAAIARDVTQRRAGEDQLKEVNAKLQDASRNKDAFLARMSHDLRTPLTAVVGFAQLLDSDTLTPDQSESVHQILKAGRHLTQMIDEVLQVVRAEAGAVPLSVEPLHLTEVANEAVDLIRPSATRRRLVVSVDAGDPARSWVLGDRQRTTEILLNLLSNAVKYNRDGGTIHVAISSREDKVRISVIDTGPGLSPDQCRRVFNPFERLDAANRHIEGTGLGLALAKSMAVLMNGQVGVDSEVDRGSAFWLELARTAPLLNAVDHSVSTVGSAPASVGVSGTILYIDDTPSNLLLIGRLMERRPLVTLLTASSGEEGLALSRTHRPDLVLLDFHLADMTGEDVIRLLGEDTGTRAIPIVVLTADAGRTPGVHVIAGRSIDCLSKPIDMPRFVAMVDERLGRREALV